MGDRHAILLRMLRQSTPALPELGDNPRLCKLDGDAGGRRYYLIEGAPELLAVDAPPSSEQNLPFVRIADLLHRAALPVPRVHLADIRRGYLLVQNLGDTTLMDLLRRDPAAAAARLPQALGLLDSMRGLSQPHWLPLYSRRLLMAEMGLMRPWFLERLLDIKPSAAARAMLQSSMATLADEALAQPQGFVHRDFHCRNLMVRERDLAMVDFQDAVWGPLFYDLVSLVRDCYVRWPVQLVHSTLGDFAARHCPDITDEQRRRWLDCMGLQRHLKVLGIFARLHLRDGKDGYLRDLPLVLQYCLEASAAWPDLAQLHLYLQRTVLPQAMRRRWWHDQPLRLPA